MKISYIYIDGYKNLKDIEIYLDEGSVVNALIGNNGSGKSNVLEAVATVFAATYNDQPVGFTYDIQYQIYDSK